MGYFSGIYIFQINGLNQKTCPHFINIFTRKAQQTLQDYNDGTQSGFLKIRPVAWAKNSGGLVTAFNGPKEKVQQALTSFTKACAIAVNRPVEIKVYDEVDAPDIPDGGFKDFNVPKPT